MPLYPLHGGVLGGGGQAGLAARARAPSVAGLGSPRRAAVLDALATPLRAPGPGSNGELLLGPSCRDIVPPKPGSLVRNTDWS